MDFFTYFRKVNRQRTDDSELNFSVWADERVVVPFFLVRFTLWAILPKTDLWVGEGGRGEVAGCNMLVVFIFLFWFKKCTYTD